jgi:hypothetical protein
MLPDLTGIRVRPRPRWPVPPEWTRRKPVANIPDFPLPHVGPTPHRRGREPGTVFIRGQSNKEEP